MKSNMARRALTVAAALALAATAAAAANAIAVDPGEQRQGSLASFGPLMDNGFPTSYKDSHALRLEACITAADPLCASAAGDTYDPDQPLSFPNNFPDEFFYQLASAKVPVPGNGELLVENNLEGAFLGNGSPAKDQQVVFGRVRIRAKDVPAGTTWRITHPYGVDVLTADAKSGINETEDIGVAAGNFSGALSSRIGPFLKWDPSVAPAAPAGYTGDPGVLHKVVGSPYDTNYIKVEQKNDDGSWSQVGQWDDQFSVQGRWPSTAGSKWTPPPSPVTTTAASWTSMRPPMPPSRSRSAPTPPSARQRSRCVRSTAATTHGSRLTQRSRPARRSRSSTPLTPRSRRRPSPSPTRSPSRPRRTTPTAKSSRSRPSPATWSPVATLLL